MSSCSPSDLRDAPGAICCQKSEQASPAPSTVRYRTTGPACQVCHARNIPGPSRRHPLLPDPPLTRAVVATDLRYQPGLPVVKKLGMKSLKFIHTFLLQFQTVQCSSWRYLIQSALYPLCFDWCPSFEASVLGYACTWTRCPLLSYKYVHVLKSTQTTIKVVAI